MPDVPADECTCDDSGHVDSMWIEGMDHADHFAACSVPTLGMFLLDVVAKSGHQPRPGAGVEVTVHDPSTMMVPPPPGWLAYTLSVEVQERMDVGV